MKTASAFRDICHACKFQQLILKDRFKFQHADAEHLSTFNDRNWEEEETPNEDVVLRVDSSLAAKMKRIIRVIRCKVRCWQKPVEVLFTKKKRSVVRVRTNGSIVMYARFPGYPDFMHRFSSRDVESRRRRDTSRARAVFKPVCEHRVDKPPDNRRIGKITRADRSREPISPLSCKF